jgi:hypothetical protein
MTETIQVTGQDREEAVQVPWHSWALMRAMSPWRSRAQNSVFSAWVRPQPWSASAMRSADEKRDRVEKYPPGPAGAHGRPGGDHHPPSGSAA